VALCDLETSRCPRTVILKAEAARFPLASESQERVRGSTRPASSVIGRESEAGARVPSTCRDQGCKADGLIRVP